MSAEPSAPSPLSLERHFDINPQPLGSALKQFANQAGLQIMYSPDLVAGRTSSAVNGQQSGAEALQKLLRGTGLEFVLEGTTVAVRAVNSAESGGHGRPTRDASATTLRLTQAPDPSRPGGQEKQGVESQKSEGEDQKGVPEILVKGARSLNTDIARTEDAPQPYVVFDREEIQRSQASNLDEFLRTRLPMNTANSSASQPLGQPNTDSGTLNLRGLGTNQTLVLVDGRRLPGSTVSGIPEQPDLNGIPLAAIERIEVLPSTGGGIYGGSATGGVVNVILRRDFQGMEVRASYGNTFNSDVGNKRIDISGGMSLEDGRTRVMMSASYATQNVLLQQDRDFASRGLALQLKNNRASIMNASLPPLGATVNIRSTANTLTLDPGLGGTVLSENFTYIPLGYAGVGSDDGLALVNNAGQFNLDQPPGLSGGARGLLAAPTMESFSLNVRREFGSRVEAFIDVGQLGNRGRSSGASLPTSVRLAGSAPNNPFVEDINVRFPITNLSFENTSESTTLRATGGIIARLPGNWMAELDYGWSRARYGSKVTGQVISDAGLTALETGALDVLQEGNTHPIDFSAYLLPAPNTLDGPYNTILKDTTLRASGPVFVLPAGPLTLSTLLESRKESVDAGYVAFINTFTEGFDYFFYPDRSQQVDSLYIEARAPLVSSTAGIPFVHELELQASVRHDEYKTVSGDYTDFIASPDDPLPPVLYSTNRFRSDDYTLSLRYAPTEDIALRASYSTGFLPPSIVQIVPGMQEFDFSFGLADPKRGDTDTYVGQPYTYLYNGNPDVKPESSKSWSAGVILTPRFAPGARLSIDYTHIDKVDEMQYPDPQFILDNEDLFPGRIVRNNERLSTDDPLWANPISSIDTRLINIANTSVDAYDIQADYSMDGGNLGLFRWYAIATWQEHYRNQALPNAPVVESVGFNGGPLDWRGNIGLDWDKGPLGVRWNTQYYNAFLVYTATASNSSRNTAVQNQGARSIPHQLYHDVIATYKFDQAAQVAGGLLANTEISAGIQNLFNTSPPIRPLSAAISGYSFYGDPRLRRYSVSVLKRF